MNLIELATHVTAQHNQAIERIGTMAAEHAEAIKAKDAEIALLNKQGAEFIAYREMMEAKVSAAVKTGDAEQFAALAVEFLTPAAEKQRLEKLARIEQLKAEAAELESTI